MSEIQLGKKDFFWNYFATFLNLGSSILLFPIILKYLPSEMVGIYTIFVMIQSFITLLDFGFNPSFTRNITYVFSGAQELHKEGYDTKLNIDKNINYSLLKSLIKAMISFYKKISFLSFFLLLTAGTYYISVVLEKYNGNKSEIYFSYILLCCVSSYNLYMSYLDCLVQGKGLISLDKKINVIGKIIFLLLSVVLIVYAHLNLLAIIIAQLVSLIFIRTALKNKFYEGNKILLDLKDTDVQDKEVMRKIYPNAVKMGLTYLGGTLITKSSLFIGSLYLSLSEIASFGISVQLVSVIGGLSLIYLTTSIPKIVSLRVKSDTRSIRTIYLKSLLIMVCAYLVGLIFIVLLAPYFLEILGSKSQLLSSSLLILLGFSSLVDTNVGLAGTILLTKNYVPFFKASLVSGFFIILLMTICFMFVSHSILVMIIIPLVVTLAYQGWKWSYELHKDLFI